MKAKEITVKADDLLSIKELITWLEKRKEINITIIIQSIGNIVNSHVDNVNRISRI